MDVQNGCQNESFEWGEVISQPTEDFEFKFTYNARESENILTVPIAIPLKRSVKELAYRLISSHSIPCYIHRDLIDALDGFVNKKTEAFDKTIYKKQIKCLKEEDKKFKFQKEWFEALANKQIKNFRSSSINPEAAWSDVYHSLIHSPALEALLRLEYSYSVAMKDLVREKSDALDVLQNKHVYEMEEIVSCVGVSKTDEDVNLVTSKQLEESQLQEIYWSSAISELQETQKREYREWVLTVHEKTIADESYKQLEPPAGRLKRTPSLESFMVNYEVVAPSQEDLMEESFTIYLGNQMKSMHNIRLVCRDILKFCQCKTIFAGGSMVPQPQRLQTAMTLYSENLSALILLVDDRFNSNHTIKNRFHSICNESTEFHFQNVDNQLCLIEQNLKNRPNRSRTLRSSSMLRSIQLSRTTNLLQTGDFYITKHSNLAEVHNVFHLVIDDSVATHAINSRHPIMIGIRNIMLAASRHSVTNLIIPLLLVHEMSENLTVQWCMKRAELVYKCVKGFMMESLSWDGNDSGTLQFVVPTGISDELFAGFSNMLPSIFRVSNTLDLSSIANGSK